MLTYIDNDFLLRNYKKIIDPTQNKAFKDSIINENFSAYKDKYDSRIYTFNEQMAPLYNEGPVSFDTLNTIYHMQGKPTTITDLVYFEKSFDEFAYLFRKEIKDSANRTLGYFFLRSEPNRYKSEALVPKLFRQKREPLPEYSPQYSYAFYRDFHLAENFNDYPFPTHLSPSDIPKTEFRLKKEKNYEELWYRNSADKVVIIVKKDNSFIEAITLSLFASASADSSSLCTILLYSLTSSPISSSRFQ